MSQGEPAHVGPLWHTRDRVGGELAEVADTWAARPERVRHADGDVTWIQVDITAPNVHRGQVALAACRTAPDSDLMCVVVA